MFHCMDDITMQSGASHMTLDVSICFMSQRMLAYMVRLDPCMLLRSNQRGGIAPGGVTS